MVIQLQILVGNANELIDLGYTHIEIHQSIDQGNSYQEITSSIEAAAVLESLSASTTFRMADKLLKLKVDGGTEQSISFSSLISNWTPTQVANRINEIIPALASVSGSKVLLTSPTLGRTSSVEITYNDAEDLGWTAEQIVYGTSARIPMVNDIFIYSFPDQAGASDDRYKWRYTANGSNPISEFSSVVTNQTATPLSADLLSVGTSQFYDASGQPKKTRILIGVDSQPQGVGEVFVTRDQPITVDSDDNGYMQFTLLRNAKVKVGIEGTSYVREFVVPDFPSFDLLTVMSTATDPFTIQTIPPLLIRRSI